MKHEDAHKRGRGDMSGPGLPDGGLEGGIPNTSEINKSLQGFPRGSLDHGCEYMGDITGDTESDPENMVAGHNNRRSRLNLKA